MYVAVSGRPAKFNYKKWDWR